MPPIFLGFPVQLFLLPFALEYHSISLSLVLISGAATYKSGLTIFNAFEKASIISFFFSKLMFLGSAIIPDLAPPKGRSAIAVFHVIALANLTTSSRETVGVILMPPFPGPKAELSMTKTPLIPTLGL